MEHKIILPLFTDEKFAGKPLTLINCIAFLARRNNSHLLLISNFTELYLFKYSEDFVFEKEIPVTEVLNGFRQFSESREFALSESTSGQIIISGPANRCFIIDEDGNIDPASYTTTVIDVPGDAHALFPQKQEAAANNLYYSATVLPQTDRLIALIDGEMGRGTVMDKKRGDFIVISDSPFKDAAQRPRFRLLAALNATPDTMYKSDFPGIVLKNGKTIRRDERMEENLTDGIREKNGITLFRPWISSIYPLTSSLILVPVFDQYRNLSAKACFLLVNTDGTVAGQLRDIQPDKIKLKALEEFNFAVNDTEQFIYFKGQNILYIFGFDGTCLDKIILEGAAKPLAAFQLIGQTVHGNLLFFDRKNFHFLQFPCLKPRDENNLAVIENALTVYKKHKPAKPKTSAKKTKDDSHIALHKVDHPEIIKENFEWQSARFDASAEKAKHTFRFLFYLFRNSCELLQMSVLTETELALQKKWFHYGLNSISEFCRLAHFEDEVKEAVIDESGTFEIKVEPTNERINLFTALCMATIARDEEKQKIIAGSPIRFWGINEKDWDIKSFGIGFLKLIKEYYLTQQFNLSLFEEMQADLEKNKSSIGPGVRQKFGYYLRSRYLNALKSLAENNESEFRIHFALAVQACKEVWGQKKALNRGGTPLCRDHEGFLSWSCTALASMAFDKGWNPGITSDYTPQYMIDGRINLK